MMKILFSWSGGKDSAMALYELLKDVTCEVASMLTVVTKDYGRISMHGVREELLELQAAALGLNLEKIYITKNSNNKEYEERMKETLMRYKKIGVEAVAFGDIFLEDLKKYREERLKEVGMEGIFPIWKRESLELANAFVELGFKAIITCVDSKMLDRRFSGRLFDKQFLSELPPGVDPCGENGEFHSFVFGGPIFREPITYKKGETVLRDGRYYYTDILTSGDS
ncbi:MAG: diphthine--ammonia ligase [Candidatus Omnitrophota bacterium]|nr:diphthine--ammonia ligase [Candidatus Omnitrophota bacterium]